MTMVPYQKRRASRRSKRSFHVLLGALIIHSTHAFLPSSSKLTTHLTTTRTQATSSTSASSQIIFNHEILQKATIELETLYSNSSTIKCPFWRRRAADFIDSTAMVLQFLAIRHKSLWIDLIDLDDLDPTSSTSSDSKAMTTETTASTLFKDYNNHNIIPGCQAIGRHVQTNPDGTIIKHYNLPKSQLKTILLNDWSTSTKKGYYITGKLTSSIYRDDCLFDGPDPDMPVRGLRKYLAAASHLFDARHSSATLLSLDGRQQQQQQQQQQQHADVDYDEKGKYGYGVITAYWKLEGVLMLPWRPQVKPWTGWTKYHLDENGLIALHEEGWDISVLEAFVGTILPDVWQIIWGEKQRE